MAAKRLTQLQTTNLADEDRLSREEEYALWNRWVNSPDKRDAQDALGTLILAHTPLCRSLAVKWSAGKEDQDDMFQAAVEKMIAILNKKEFDPSRGFRINTYIRQGVDGHLRTEYGRNSGPVKLATTKLDLCLLSNWGTLRQRVTAENPRMTSYAQAEEIARIVREEFRHKGAKASDVLAFAARTSSRHCSLNQPTSSDSDCGAEFVDFLACTDESMQPEARLQDEDDDRLSAHLKAAIYGLPERDREIIKARFCDEPVGLADLGKRFGISAERVRQIEVAAIIKMRAHFAVHPLPSRTDIQDADAVPQRRHERLRVQMA